MNNKIDGVCFKTKWFQNIVKQLGLVKFISCSMVFSIQDATASVSDSKPITVQLKCVHNPLKGITGIEKTTANHPSDDA